MFQLLTIYSSHYMKRTFLLAVFAAFWMTGTVKGQYRPEKNSVSLEVQFNPFDQNGKTFSLDGIKARYFISDQDALRLRLSLNGASNKFNYPATDMEGESYKITQYYKTTTLKVDIGYERHFNLSKRLDLYAGGLFGVSKRFANYKMKRKDEEETINSAYPGSERNPWGAYPLENQGYLGFNAAVMTGIDFYVYKGLYLGAELGFNADTKQIDKVTKDNGKKIEVLAEKSRTTSYGFYIEPVVRLGWTF